MRGRRGRTSSGATTSRTQNGASQTIRPAASFSTMTSTSTAYADRSTGTSDTYERSSTTSHSCEARGQVEQRASAQRQRPPARSRAPACLVGHRDPPLGRREPRRRPARSWPCPASFVSPLLPTPVDGIRLTDMTKRRGGRLVLDRVSFEPPWRGHRPGRRERRRQELGRPPPARARPPHPRHVRSCAAASTATSSGRCTRSEPCSTPPPRTPAGLRGPTWPAWRRATASAGNASRTCWPRPASQSTRIGGCRPSRSACDSAWQSPPPCSATPRSWCWTSRSTASIPAGSSGSAT